MKKFFKTGGIIILLALMVLCLLPGPRPVYAAEEWDEIKGRFSATAGETLATGDTVCFSDTTGYVYKADADDSGLRQCVGVIGKGGSSGDSVEVVTRGILGGQSALAEGGTAFLSATAGAITQTAVAAYPQPIGKAISTTQYQIDVAPFSLAKGAITGTTGNFSGAVALGDNLTVSGRTSLVKNTTITSNLTVTGRSTLTQNTTITSDLAVTGDATFGGGRVVVYCFENNNIVSSQAAVAMYTDAGGTVTGIPMPYAGSILAVSALSNAAITSGSMTFDPTVGGSVTGLQAILNTTDTTSDYAVQAKDTDVFSAGDLLGIKHTTPANLAPTTADVGVCITVEY